MAWTPDEEYWARKLNREREAIEELKAKIPILTEQRQIEAHELYLESVKRTLKIDEGRYRAWRNKRQNIERASNNCFNLTQRSSVSQVKQML